MTQSPKLPRPGYFIHSFLYFQVLADERNCLVNNLIVIRFLIFKMMSSGRYLHRVSKSSSHFASQLLKSSKVHEKYSSPLPALLFSTAQIPNTQDTDAITHNLKSNNTKRNINTKINMKAYSEKNLNFSQIDPNTFGNLYGKIEEEAENDAGDIAEEKYIENPPRRSQTLTTKQYANIIKEFFSQKKVSKKFRCA